MYTCRYFKIQELVSPEWYNLAKKRNCIDRLWAAFSKDILISIDRLRDRFGPLTVNTWANGGSRKESGLRWGGTETGAVISQHKFGRAIDFLCKNASPVEIYDDLVKSGGLAAGFKDRRDDAALPWVLVTRLEYYPGITWTHIDVSDLGNADGSIKVFHC